MNRIFILVFSVVCLSAAVSCRRTDIKTVIINVPDMRNRACARIIADGLARETGVQGGNTKVDLSARTVTVSYESLLTAKKNVEYAVANLGFAANSIPSNKEAAAKLPKECFEPEATVNVPAE